MLSNDLVHSCKHTRHFQSIWWPENHSKLFVLSIIKNTGFDFYNNNIKVEIQTQKKYLSHLHFLLQRCKIIELSARGEVFNNVFKSLEMHQCFNTQLQFHD